MGSADVTGSATGERVPLIATLSTAGVIASLEILLAASFATLLYSRPAPEFLAIGTGAFLAAQAVHLIAVGRTSSVDGAASTIQDAPIAVLAAVVATLGVTGTQREVYGTIVLAVILATLVTALAFYVVGAARLGKLAKYVPYPVQAAFLAATGWLLLSGGLAVAAGDGLTFSALGRLDESAFLVAAGATVLIGTVLFLASGRIASPLVIPGVVLAATVAFYVVVAINGATSAALEAGGWLPESIGTGVLWRPDAVTAALDADTFAVVRHLGDLASIPCIALLGALINYAGVELDRRNDIDTDRELRVTGLTNVAAAGVGGAPGWVSVSLTAVTKRTGAPTRTAVTLAGVIALVAVVGGAALFARLPLLVTGGLLAFLGLSFLHEYLWNARRTVPPIEYAAVVAITATVVVSGYAAGLVVGLAFATARFLILSGRDDPVDAARSGREVRSRAYRTPEEARYLTEHGDRIQVIHLSGFLFFGTSAEIADRLRTLVMHRPGGEVPRFVILDMADVSGVDATAAMGLTRLVQVAEAPGAQVLAAGMGDDVWRQLAAAGLGTDIPEEDRFSTVDAALERAEDVVLLEGDVAHGAVDELARLRGHFARPETFTALRRRMRRISVAAGERICSAGDEDRNLFVVASGRVRVERDAEDPHERVRTLGPGDVLGEGAFYAGRRGAGAVAEVDSELWRVRGESLDELVASDPATAADLHRAFARLLVERLGEVIHADGTLLR